LNLFFGPGLDRPVRAALDIVSYLPAAKKYHYRDGYCMAEAAKSWVAANGSLPIEIAAIVGNDGLSRAHLEYPTRVIGGGIAMTDVMAFLPDGGVIAVEAKVDEPFDYPVSIWIEREAKRNPRSPAHRRKAIQEYADVFGVQPEMLMDIRYQLLQRTLCAAITARSRNFPNAWMIIHSFPSTRAGVRNENRREFDRYVSLVGDQPTINGIQVRLAWASQA
jgi:hypothetical protein